MPSRSRGRPPVKRMRGLPPPPPPRKRRIAACRLAISMSMSGIGPGPPGPRPPGPPGRVRRDRRHPMDRPRRPAEDGRSRCPSRREEIPRDPGRCGPRWGRHCSSRLYGSVCAPGVPPAQRPIHWAVGGTCVLRHIGWHRRRGGLPYRPPASTFATHLGRRLLARPQRWDCAHGRHTRTPCARHCARSRTRRPARDIVSAGLVEGIELRGGLVQVSLLTDRAHAAAMEPVRQEVEALLARQPGVTNATAVLTAHKAGPAGTMPRPAAAGGAAGGRARAAQAAHGAARGTWGGSGRAWRARPQAAGRAEAGAAAAGGEGDRRGGLRQGRRGEIHRGGEPGGGAGAAGACRSGCSTPTSTARACRACWG